MKLLLSLIWRHAKVHPLQAALMVALTLVTSVLWVVEPLYSSYAVDTLLGISRGETVNVMRIALIWGSIFVTTSILQGLDKYLLWRHNILIEIERTERSFAHLLSLDLAFHHRQKGGEAIKTIDDGATELAHLSRTLIELTPSALSSLAFLVISFRIEPRLAVILLGTLLLYCGIVVIGTTKTAALQQKINRLWVRPTGKAYDAVVNVASVKSAGRERFEVERMHGIYAEAIGWQFRLNRMWALLEAMNFFMLTRILLIAIGVLLLARGELSLGELYFFQASFYRVLVPFEMLAGVLPQWNKSMGKIRISEELLHVKPEPGLGSKGKTLGTVRGNLRLENVSFIYNRAIPIVTRGEDEEEKMPATEQDGEETEEVLRGITLDVRAGEHIAFVGHSGAGKSTLAALLNRFYDPTSGRILIDGTDVRDLDVQWWRGQIGLVMQENLMFHDTILENIRYARPEATREEVIEATTRASADEFIRNFAKGYDTVVGERGVRLSGGERQRVAIARAILKKPSIVILDEATSALDSITERAVQHGIKELITGRTSFIIAHRLSTVRSVDRIALLDKGRLVACAPHEELMRVAADYKKMVELQHEGLLAE